MSDFVTGSLVAIISFVLGLSGKIIYDFWHDNHIEKKEQRKEAMKNHFELLSKKVIYPMISQFKEIHNYWGELSPSGGGRHWSHEDIHLILNVPSEDFKIFALHFSDYSLLIRNLIKKMNEHNSQFDKYIDTLRSQLNSIHPLSTIPLNSSFLYAELTGNLRMTLFQIAHNKYHDIEIQPTHDFNEAKIIKEGNYWILTNPHESVGYARLTTQEEALACKTRLSELQNSTELILTALELSSQAETIEQSFPQMVSFLEFILEYHTSLKNIMGKNKKCMYCQAII